MDDSQLLRYNRHILLPEIDIDGQQRLLAATVMIIGLGGLGCPAAQYMAAAGVGNMILVDDDQVELVNLQRQILYGSDCLGESKAEAAGRAARRINETITIEPICVRADQGLLTEQLSRCDVVVDCSDNMRTRLSVNRCARQAGVVLVSAAAIRWQGQLAVFSPESGQPCYQCLYPDESSPDALACSEAGVAGPVVGALGTLQALETLKQIIGLGQQAYGRLWQLDGLHLEWTELQFRRRNDCPVCA